MGDEAPRALRGWDPHRQGGPRWQQSRAVRATGASRHPWGTGCAEKKPEGGRTLVWGPTTSQRLELGRAAMSADTQPGVGGLFGDAAAPEGGSPSHSLAFRMRFCTSARISDPAITLPPAPTAPEGMAQRHLTALLDARQSKEATAVRQQPGPPAKLSPTPRPGSRGLSCTRIGFHPPTRRDGADPAGNTNIRPLDRQPAPRRAVCWEGRDQV